MKNTLFSVYYLMFQDGALYRRKRNDGLSTFIFHDTIVIETYLLDGLNINV